jgi:tetratricopeptide (TPR) repeat protein
VSFWSRLERKLTDLAGDILPDEFREQVDSARRLLEDGRTQEATEVLEALLTGRPNHAVALSLLGAARMELGQTDAAADAFARALSADPGLPEAHLGRAEACAAQGRDDQATAAFRAALGLASGDRGVLHHAYRGLGLTYRRGGDLDKAIRELRKAVAEDPADGVALGALGEALLADDDVSDDEAARYLGRAESAAESWPTAWIGLGELALRNGDAERAGAHFERAASMAAEHPLANAVPMREAKLRALMGLGDAALIAGRADESNRFFLQALELDPRSAAVHARLGDVHRHVGNTTAALSSYDRALDLAGQADDDVLDRALDTAIAARAMEPAVRLANRVLARDPNDGRALLARGLALAAEGNDVAARATFRTVLDRHDDPDAHVALGRLDLEGAPVTAAALALRALRARPSNTAARELLADARARELGAEELGREAAPGRDVDASLYRLASRLYELTTHSPALAELGADASRTASDFDQPLLVTVMGEFSSGKSSFVNAFIGDDVAPTGITPTTATINVVKYGRERGGRILYRSGEAEMLPWAQLLAALRGLTEDAARAVRLVEILVPIAALERINIVDTPGLNSILPEHEEVARGFIKRADAVVWLFTANQAGKKSERGALETIRAEGVRILGVLNKIDQLSEQDAAEVTTYVRGELGELVEAVVPFSARQAMAARIEHAAGSDGNWAGLEAELERRFFAQARDIKREVCQRRLGDLLERARGLSSQGRIAAARAGAALEQAARDTRALADQFEQDSAPEQRRELVAAVAGLYRNAAREVLELVQPRRLPFGSHSATEADRDYLISLLQGGYEAALEHSRRAIAAELRARSGAAITAAASVGDVLGADAAGDLARTAEDALRLLDAQVFASARAYLVGYLRGGFVDRFFRSELPKIDLTEDAVYHALYRDSPDLDTRIGAPLARAGRAAIESLAARLEHWSGVAEVQAFDVEVGVDRAIDTIDERRRGLLPTSS